MTGSARIELLERALGAWRGAQVGDLDEWAHERIEIHAQLSALRGEPYRGHAGVRQWCQDLLEIFEHFEIGCDELREVGGRVLGLGWIRWRGKDSHVEMRQELGWVFEFAGGRVVRMDVHADRRDALAAVGLRR